MLATVSSTPRTRPGKKPTRTAVIGNLLHDSEMGAVVLNTGVDVADDDEAVGRAVEAVVEVEVEDEEIGAVCWLAFISQSLFELQLYPKGQHWLPHVGRFPDKSVVMSEMPGCAVTFCWVMSHEIDLIVRQDLPVGQHSTVVLAASTTQLFPDGQQKSDGRP